MQIVQNLNLCPWVDLDLGTACLYLHDTSVHWSTVLALGHLSLGLQFATFENHIQLQQQALKAIYVYGDKNLVFSDLWFELIGGAVWKVPH